MSLAWNCLLFPLAIYFPVSVLSFSWNPLQWDKLQCRGFSTCHSVFHLMAVRSELDGCSAYCSSYEEINYEISREKTAAIGQRRDRGGQMVGDVGEVFICRLTGVLLGRMLPVAPLQSADLDKQLCASFCDPCLSIKAIFICPVHSFFSYWTFFITCVTSKIEVPTIEEQWKKARFREWK